MSAERTVKVGEVDKWKYLVIHHTATNKHKTFKEIRQEHLNLGWRDVGYHYLVGYVNGKALFVAGRPTTMRGAHTDPDKLNTSGDLVHPEINNGTALGIAIIGSYEREDPPNDLINELAYGIMLVAKKYGIPLDKEHVRPHYDVSATLCPGKRTMELVWKKIEKAKKAQAGKPAAATKSESIGDGIRAALATATTGATEAFFNLRESMGLPAVKPAATEAPAPAKTETTNKQEATGMFSAIFQFVAAITALIVANENDTSSGAEKKAAVLRELKELIQAGGLTIPAYLTGILDGIAGWLIDLLVKKLNESGYFQKKS